MIRLITFRKNINIMAKTLRFMSVNHLCSYPDNHVFNIPIGGKIPDVDQTFEDHAQWTKGRAVSTLQHTGECGGSSPAASRFSLILTSVRRKMWLQGEKAKKCI